MRGGPAFRTSGGIPVYVEASHALPLVDVDVVILRGSRLDPPGSEGLTRLTVRLMRRGPRGLSREAFDARLDSLGATLGSSVTPETVRIHGSVIRRNLEPFLAEIGAVLARPALRQRDLRRLRRITEAEIVQLRDHDSALAARAFRQQLFGAHPYGRPVSGTLASVRGLRLEDVRRTHRALARAGQMVIGLAGDITPREAQAALEGPLAELAPGAVERPRARAARMARGRRVVLVDKPRRTQTQAYVGTLGLRMGDPRTHALVVANTAFGGTFTSRLMREVRSERGWSYGAYSRLSADRQREAWSMWTHPASEQLLDCLRLQLELYDAWLERGLTRDEVRRTKRHLIKGHAFDRETAHKRLEPQLQRAVYGLPADWYSSFEERVGAVTRRSAHEAVRACLSREDLTIAVLATATPALERGLADLPGIRSVRVRSYEDL